MSEQDADPKRAREEGEEVAAEPGKRKHTKLDESDSSIPRNAIKRIMKLDSDVKNIQVRINIVRACISLSTSNLLFCLYSCSLVGIFQGGSGDVSW